MKWIGQQIYDFVSRFRNDVYLEDISTGTIASGGNLGLDSNNKIVKADTESGELTITNAGDNRVTTSTGGTGLNAEANFLFDGNDITLGADNDTETKIQKLAHSDDHAGQISILGANATAGQTNKRGGRLALYTGLSTGNSQNGGIDFYTALTGSTGTSLSSYQSNPMASFYSTANSGRLDMYEAAGSTMNDRFRINVEAAGVTTLSTLDASGGVAAVLTLDADGLINIDSARNGGINFLHAGTYYAQFDTGGSTSNFILYEAGGASFDDYFKISIATKGNTTIKTVDAAGSDGHLNIEPDGDVTFNPTTGVVRAGWHGSITRIKILPSDFIPDDVGRPAMIDDTSGDRWLESFSTAKLYASLPIPNGYAATHVKINGSGTPAVIVYEANIDSATVTSKGTGNVGTEINITDVTSDATNYILIELSQGTSDRVYGGYITINAV